MKRRKSFRAKFCLIIMCVALLVPSFFCPASAEDDTAETMRNMYGENEVITGDYDKDLSVTCKNGTFVGKEDNSVISYKGIPYAKAPTGELRWKAPVEPEDSDAVREAYYFGKSPIQTEWVSEVGSYYEQGEDCLTLNVWSSEKVTKDKTVMVFFHGGSYGWGGTSDPIYDGQNFVEAHPDVILVTVEYRLGIMGFIDFSAVDGGEDYKESGNLGLLDMVCSLKWIQKNISSFGGNPDNVTIFGESAGGGAVSLLPLIDGTAGLFNRVIAESGSIAFTYSKDECTRLTEMLLEETGAENMDDLLNLSEEELMAANENLNDYNNFPERDGIVIPEDLYAAYEEGKAADVDLLIGTNADEARYWISEMGYTVPVVDGELVYKIGIPVMYQSDTKNFSDEDKEYLNTFMESQTDSKVWNITEFYNEILFRVPSIYEAEKNAANGGNAYMYYWDYPSSIGNLGACHAVELSSVFNNLEDTIYTGDNVKVELAQTVQNMWVNFAKTGDPSVEGTEWEQYSAESRKTMVLGENIHMETNLLEEQRSAIEPLLKYHLAGCYTRLDLNVPVVYEYVAIAVACIAVIVAAIVIPVHCVKKSKKKQAATAGK